MPNVAINGSPTLGLEGKWSSGAVFRNASTWAQTFVAGRVLSCSQNFTVDNETRIYGPFPFVYGLEPPELREVVRQKIRGVAGSGFRSRNRLF
jgi:hypothetical protein